MKGLPLEMTATDGASSVLDCGAQLQESQCGTNCGTFVTSMSTLTVYATHEHVSYECMVHAVPLCRKHSREGQQRQRSMSCDGPHVTYMFQASGGMGGVEKHRVGAPPARCAMQGALHTQCDGTDEYAQAKHECRYAASIQCK
jgi:hypothetical protein